MRISIAIVFLALTATISCKKSDGPTTAEFQAITFKFGQDATPITITQATQTSEELTAQLRSNTIGCYSRSSGRF
jgi:hypothetical protein